MLSLGPIRKPILSILLVTFLVYVVCKSLVEYKKEEIDYFCSNVIEMSRKLSHECNAFVPETYQRQLLISGTGRSGTHWMTGLLQETGVDVLHEEIGADGSVSWMYALNDNGRGYPWGCREGLDVYSELSILHTPQTSSSSIDCLIGSIRFRQIFHQVRFPLNSISSMTTYKQKSWDFISFVNPPFPNYNGTTISFSPMKTEKMSTTEINSQLIRRAAYHWVSWNSFVEKIADYTYKIEEVDPFELCTRAGFGDRCQKSILKDEIYKDSRDHASLTWKQLEEIDKTLANLVKEMAIRYGYDPNFDEYRKSS